MIDVEKLGSFYLGKLVNPATEKTTDDPLLYESKNLTTHAVCVGMTGSGKTGLGIAVLEEAGLQSIPAIIIDPKGDLTNLLLTFPTLSKEEFLPWIDESEAKRQEMTDQQYAEFLSKTWKNGLQDSFEDGARIQKLKSSVDMVIYTPASQAGVPLSILSSFKAPSQELRKDAEFMRDRVLALTSSLLGLLGVAADPIKSREHIMISTIIDEAWKKGEDLDIAALITKIQEPDFDKLGALDLETFFPKKERQALAVRLNGLIASRSFQAWMEGEPLNIQNLLFNKENKPKLSILSIAHLSDSEKMFFVTLLLGEFLAWMQKQPGSSSLKAILYMDEIFGYFPPISQPPSKLPMLKLLKTARAFGVGIFLATQNPVDLDYKGLANCGTWFIGKLQTERDKLRVLEGLRIASNGELNTETLDNLISGIKKRTFIMRSVNEKNPIVFETRWTLSYLKGPLTLPQIERLTKKEDRSYMKTEVAPINQGKPFLSSNIREYFLKTSNFLKETHYKPSLLGTAKLHFVDSKNKVDVWKTVYLLFPIDKDTKNISLNEAEDVPDIKTRLEKRPVQECTYEDIPSGLLLEKNLSLFQRSFAASLYQNQSLSLFQSKELNLVSELDESKADFSKRAKEVLEITSAQKIKITEDKYNEKIAAINDRMRRADDKLAVQKQQSLLQKIEAFISFLTTIFSAFLGKRLTKGTVTQVGTSMRRAGRITKENQEVLHAEDTVKSYETQIEELKKQKESEILQVKSALDETLNKIETLEIKPRKSDIVIDELALVWQPE